MRDFKNQNGCAEVVAIVVAFVAFTTWVTMLAAGTIAGFHNWYSPSFGETYLWLLLIGIVGSFFHSAANAVKK